MKKIITLALFLLSFSANAQTIISTSSVSGTWTLAGSPYIVQVQTSVLAGQVLTIQPGVVVRFQATTKLTVTGQLIASGTAISPIVFQADDTTSWSDQNTTAGGWSGIHFLQYSGAGTDNSILNYCTLKDAKFGYAAYANYLNALTVERSLKILNCIFEHNNNGTGAAWSEAPIYIYNYFPTDTVEMNNCILTNNYTLFNVVSANSTVGYLKILNSDFNNNIGGAIWTISHNTLLEGNIIHDNNTTGGNSTIEIIGGEVFVRFNKIYRNSCEQLAAVGCRAGKVTIENNLICNNRQNEPSCGAAGGGGGIHLAHNDGSPFLDTYYYVRNNIIANNYSAYGGGGVYVYQARATISNNHIINNSTNSYGKSILVLNAVSEVNLKNNIIFSKSASGIVDTTNTVYIFSANTIELDYNYLSSSYTKSVQTAFGFTLVGDTINNVIGNDPGMIAPTADNNYMTDALTANFNLLSSSPCINQGDTTGTFPSVIDYAGNSRISGAFVDIGAYEFGQTEGIFDQVKASSEVSVYPNPAKDYFIIAFEKMLKKAEMSISDITGKVIYKAELSETEKTEVETKTFAEGIYFLQLRVADHIETKKIVIVR